MSQGFTNPFGSFSPLLSYQGLTFPNPKTINGFVGNAGTGDIDLYTVPSNRRVLVYGLGVFFTGISSTSCYPEIKVSGSYYKLQNGQTIITNSFAQSWVFNYIAEAGETIAVNSSVSGANIWLKGIEFDDTSGCKTAKLTSVVNGDNTLYTVPAGKTALILNSNPATLTSGTLIIWNNSGGTRTYNLFAVPNGGSSDTSNKVRNALSVNAAIFNESPFVAALNTGDFIVVNSDASTATQFVYITVCEV
jgi:hypothetical protein